MTFIRPRNRYTGPPRRRPPPARGLRSPLPMGCANERSRRHPKPTPGPGGAHLHAHRGHPAHQSSPIRVEAARDGTHVAVSVSDQGRGVPPEMLGQLFRKHVAFTGGHAEGGTEAIGLGLAICKGLVETSRGPHPRRRAQGWVRARGSPSRFPWPKARKGCEAPARRCVGETVHPSSWTTTRTRFAPCATHSPRWATPCGSPRNRARLRTSSAPRSRSSCCSTSCCPGPAGSSSWPKSRCSPTCRSSSSRATGRDETIARAFEAGAADFIVKPFSPTELTARVGAALRSRAGAEPFVLGALAIDYDQRRVTVDGRAVALTATEYEQLRILSVNAGRVCDHRFTASARDGARATPATGSPCAPS